MTSSSAKPGSVPSMGSGREADAAHSGDVRHRDGHVLIGRRKAHLAAVEEERPVGRQQLELPGEDVVTDGEPSVTKHPQLRDLDVLGERQLVEWAGPGTDIHGEPLGIEIAIGAREPAGMTGLCCWR